MTGGNGGTCAGGGGAGINGSFSAGNGGAGGAGWVILWFI
jgi:hypothetical protein